MTENNLKQLYFSHDIFADRDEKIVKMFYYFRKNISDFSDEFIRENFFHASYGLFWEIVQYLHRNELKVDDIPMLADELRADETFVRMIIENFNLFRIDEEGKIISDRILKNLDNVSQKSNKNKNAVQVRWLLHDFNKAYVEFFGEEPVLSTSEIEVLKQYNEKIPDLKSKLRDIVYTLKNLKFKTDINFKPCANWLLKDNNLARLVNGEYGALKHCKTEKEIKAEEKAYLEKQEENRITNERNIQEREAVCDKESALEYLYNHIQMRKFDSYVAKNSLFKEFSQKYDFDLKTAMDYFKQRDEVS